MNLTTFQSNALAAIKKEKRKSFSVGKAGLLAFQPEAAQLIALRDEGLISIRQIETEDQSTHHHVTIVHGCELTDKGRAIVGE